MRFTAPAKVNLNLHVTGRRADGYHLLDSKIVFTTWGDEITIKPADHFILTADGPYSNIFSAKLLSTDRGSTNLITKAVYLMADHANIDPKIHIHVTKNIPAGAGLGGGSSDAASVMHALNNLWGMALPLDKLCEMGLELGAELPVCLYQKPSRVTGIGEAIEPVDVGSMPILIALHECHSSTKQVFGNYHKNPVTDHPYNDLTEAAVSLYPQIGKTIDSLAKKNGCLQASMTGSGSACIGLFETEDQAHQAAKNFDKAIVTEVQGS